MPTPYEQLLQAARACVDDHATSALHHPDHVLVPRAAFEQLRAVADGVPVADLSPTRAAALQEVRALLAALPQSVPDSEEYTSAENLRWMLERCQHEIRTLPEDKVGRWTGYVHGVLAHARLLDVDAVRARSRGPFQAAYRATGQAVPATRSRVQ